jgi:helix-turn-helix protein
MNAIDLGHLRHVALTAFEVKTLTLLASSGGEVKWYPHIVKPLTAQCMDQLIEKRLVMIVDRSGVDAVRLTEEGRKVVAQLDAMAVKPKIEVASG